MTEEIEQEAWAALNACPKCSGLDHAKRTARVAQIVADVKATRARASIRRESERLGRPSGNASRGQLLRYLQQLDPAHALTEENSRVEIWDAINQLETAA